MAETEPKPKPPQLTSSCWKCNTRHVSKEGDTMSFVYTKQPWFSNTQVTCPGKDCNSMTILFHDAMPENVRGEALRYPTQEHDFCDEVDIKEIRRKATNAVDLVPRQLSVRQMNQLDHLAEFLQTIEVTVQDFAV